MRKEINPNIVKQADASMGGGTVSNIRRNFMSGTKFGLASSEELMLDTELTSHLSYKNLFHTSKMV